MEHLPDAPYRLFSCNLLFYIRHNGFDRLLHQGDVESVADFDPPAGGGLDFGFQRVCEVLHLGFHQLLDVIQVDGLDGCFGFASGKAYDGATAFLISSRFMVIHLLKSAVHNLSRPWPRLWPGHPEHWPGFLHHLDW